MQGWEHSPPTNVDRVRFRNSASYVGWVCRFSTLHRDVFSGYSGFPSFHTSSRHHALHQSYPDPSVPVPYKYQFLSYSLAQPSEITFFWYCVSADQASFWSSPPSSPRTAAPLTVVVTGGEGLEGECWDAGLLQNQCKTLNLVTACHLVLPLQNASFLLSLTNRIKRKKCALEPIPNLILFVNLNKFPSYREIRPFLL